jgi:predicted nucleic acid-binding protein
MTGCLFDSCILIDYLQGKDSARLAFEQHPLPHISMITWMEVMAGVPDEHEATVRAWLHQFPLAALDHSVARRAVVLRKTHRIKLPDAIILATVDVNGWRLVTRYDRLMAIAGGDNG